MELACINVALRMRVQILLLVNLRLVQGEGSQSIKNISQVTTKFFQVL